MSNRKSKRPKHQKKARSKKVVGFKERLVRDHDIDVSNVDDDWRYPLDPRLAKVYVDYPKGMTNDQKNELDFRREELTYKDSFGIAILLFLESGKDHMLFYPAPKIVDPDHPMHLTPSTRYVHITPNLIARRFHDAIKLMRLEDRLGVLGRTVKGKNAPVTLYDKKRFKGNTRTHTRDLNKAQQDNERK